MNNTDIVKHGLKKRYAKEKRFQWYGRLAVLTGFVFLTLLLLDIIIKAMPAFQSTQILLDIPLDRETLELSTDATINKDTLSAINYDGLIKKSLSQLYPQVSKRNDRKQLYKLVSSGAEFSLREYIMKNPELISSNSEIPVLSIWLKADDDIDTFYKLQTKISRVSDRQVEFIDSLTQHRPIRTSFNTTCFTASDS